MASGQQIVEFSLKTTSLTFTPGPAGSVIVQANSDVIEQIETTNGFADRELIGDDDNGMRSIFPEPDAMKLEVVRGIEGKQRAIMFRRKL